jgi:hypothetical protein
MKNVPFFCTGNGCSNQNIRKKFPNLVVIHTSKLFQSSIEFQIFPWQIICSDETSNLGFRGNTKNSQNIDSIVMWFYSDLGNRRSITIKFNPGSKSWVANSWWISNIPYKQFGQFLNSLRIWKSSSNCRLFKNFNRFIGGKCFNSFFWLPTSS